MELIMIVALAGMGMWALLWGLCRSAANGDAHLRDRWR